MRVEEITWDDESALLIREPDGVTEEQIMEQVHRCFDPHLEADEVDIGAIKFYRKFPCSTGDFDMRIIPVPEGANTRGAFRARLVT